MPVGGGVASSLLTTRKVAAYGVVSIFAALTVILSAFRQRSNFYSAAVMLGRSNGCMMVLFNLGFFLTLCIGLVCQKVFFGPLRPVEVEHLYERSWYAVTESLLAMTIFRDDFGANFVFLFGTLLFLKVFHWLSADRVEMMEQSPSVTRLFHVRMMSVLTTLLGLDFFLVAFAVEVLILEKNRMGIMVMFASEFMILSITLWSTIAKYVINVHDMRSEETWEAKSLYVFFVDLAADFLKLVTYITFFALILSYYGLPLNIIRDVYMTARSFFGRLRDFIKYRAATKNMDTKFADATQQELSAMSDGTCIICREEMTAAGTDNARPDASVTPAAESGTNNQRGTLNETPKKLPCGHIFHFHCLRSWLERQQSCPTCRRTVFADAQNTSSTSAPPAAQGGQGPLRPTNAPNTASASTTQRAAQTPRDQLNRFLQDTQAQLRQARESADQHAQQAARRQTRQPTFDASSQAAPSSTSAPIPGGESSRGLPTTSRFNQGLSDEMARKSFVKTLFESSHPSLGSSSRERRLKNNDDEIMAQIIPPAPSTLRSSRSGSSSTEVRPDQSVEQTTTSKRDTSSIEKESAEEANGKTSPSIQDPTDAREAARAAALKRFGASNASASGPQSSSSHRSTSNTKEQLGASTSSTVNGQNGSRLASLAVPEDPHLIPLFDPSLIQNYDIDFASKLPLPIVNNFATRKTTLPRTDSTSTHYLGQEEGEATRALLQLTSEEMTRLSKRNRSSLEERLRLMSRVEGAIGGLVEELTRALSAMPDSDDIQPDEEGSSEAAKVDKGKSAAEGVHS